MAKITGYKFTLGQMDGLVTVFILGQCPVRGNPGKHTAFTVLAVTGSAGILVFLGQLFMPASREPGVSNRMSGTM